MSRRRSEPLILALALLLGGCAWTQGLMQSTVEPVRHAEWLAKAAGEDSKGRQRLWDATRGPAGGDDATVRRAWLMSLSGHEGYAPAEAAGKLRALAPTLDDDVDRALFLTRAELLDEVAQCQVQARGLQRRLDRIIEIEQNLQSDE